MHLTAQDLHRYLRPSLCERRVYLYSSGVEQEPASDFEQVIRMLGQQHEEAHLQSLTGVLDLSGMNADERFAATLAAVKAGDAEVIYQPLFRTAVEINGVACTVSGQPDFLIREGSNYVVRDSKMARRVTEEAHPEIVRQLQLYGWLYRACFERECARLEVLSGSNTLVSIAPDDSEMVLQDLRTIVQIKESQREPYSPVGWSKCGGCPFSERCWAIAQQEQDVAILIGVDQQLARTLRQAGVSSVEDLENHFDEDTLSNFKRPWGLREQKVGKKAAGILRSAQAVRTGQTVVSEHPVLPQGSNFVMFDLEGLPPHLDALDKIYLWGTQVFGVRTSNFLPALAGFGANGDCEGWRQFLKNSQDIFDQYGDIPFIHWHHYERVKIDQYVERFGDENGIASRVKRNLFDLLPVAQRCVALPVPSYSLKVVEKYIGFERSQDEYGGDWSIAKYIQATETRDQSLRDAVMEEILTYNREDLAATWAVFKWLKSFEKKNHFEIGSLTRAKHTS